MLLRNGEFSVELSCVVLIGVADISKISVISARRRGRLEAKQ